MAGTLPTVRGGVQCLTPLVRSVTFATDVSISLNSTEQRAKRHPALTTFKLNYTRLPATDMAALRTFWEAQRGQFDSGWSFTLGATTYSHLTFTDSEFTFREEAATPTFYGVQLNARQTQNPGMASGAAGAAFPTLASGKRAMLPYQQMRKFSVLLNDNPACGLRYSWVWQGLAGFPSRSLRGWEVQYPILTDADLATVETHYRNQFGQFGLFSYTDDDDATVYPKCRYASDSLDITTAGPNQHSLTLRIMETN